MQTNRFSLIVTFMAVLVVGLGAPVPGLAEDAPNFTIPTVAPHLGNGDFECATGYYETTNGAGEIIRVPNDWLYVAPVGSPRTNSARIQYTGSCDGSGHVERISGEDSFVVRAQDMETPPEPGKPFDAVLLQQVDVVPGGAYSLSGWALTLCGGSAVPNDCPDGYYMSKQLGLDPTGGTDPLSADVQWVENRNNFISPNGARIGWSNLQTSAVAQASTMTVFARLESPFRWHGNHGFIDALSFVRAPAAWFDKLPAAVDGSSLALAWNAEQSPDIAAIPAGTYALQVDIQTRPQGDESWRALAVGITGADAHGTLDFVAPCTNIAYEFRLRARSEQPPAPPEGASPNQRYPGVWSEPVAVFFRSATNPAQPPGATGTHALFLPLITHQVQC